MQQACHYNPLTSSATDERFALHSEASAVLEPLQATELGTYIATLREPYVPATRHLN